MKSDSAPLRPGPRRLRTALFLALACLLPGPALAQDGSRPVSCRFLCMDGATPPAALLCQGAKGAEVACAVPANSPSAATVCFATNHTLKFLTSEDRQPAATATIPPAVKAAILVFVPAAKQSSGLPWRVFVIEDSPGNFPDGGAFVANFYSQNIRFVIGEHKVILKPAAAHGLAMPSQRDEFNMAPVTFEFQQDKAWRSVSESLLRFVPGQRYLVIAYVDPASGRPRMFVSTDITPAAAPLP